MESFGVHLYTIPKIIGRITNKPKLESNWDQTKTEIKSIKSNQINLEPMNDAFAHLRENVLNPKVDLIATATPPPCFGSQWSRPQTDLVETRLPSPRHLSCLGSQWSRPLTDLVENQLLPPTTNKQKRIPSTQNSTSPMSGRLSFLFYHPFLQCL